jgi:hypothetical protein
MNPISHAISKSILNGLLLVATLVLLTGTAIAQPAPSLQWELVNPFRFIHDQKTIDELRTIYAGLSDQSASALERKLQDLADTEVDEIRRQARTKFDCDHTNSDEEKRQCFAPYSGWFARLAANNHGKTCWDSAAHEYRRVGPCKDYIYPQSHRVRVWVENPESLGNALPQWTVNPAPMPSPTPCDAKPDKRFCVEFNIPYQSENPIEVRVSAQFPSLTLATNPNIKVKDLLIVGLGDSYAAGEGNPDVPATFVDSDLKSGRHPDLFAALLAGHNKNLYPQKDKAAVWLEQRCHRSMYSYQFKTALQLALAHPQQAITYVSFSCSGAVADDIIKNPQAPREKGDNEKAGNLLPQLEALRKALQRPNRPTRPIDYLLLSTGGNDVGFANYVAYILVRNKPLLLALALIKQVSEKKMQESFASHKFEQELLGKPGQPGNYVELENALFDPGTPAEPNAIKIRDCQAGSPCARIILTPYPNILTDENQQPCNADRLEFDEFFGQDKRVPRIAIVTQFVFDQITDVQSKVHARLGWTVIDGNVAQYFRHGFCSHDSQSLSNGEKFQVPTWLNNGWLQYDPRDYKAYESRFRWFRLPVDAVLTTDQTRDFNGEQKHLLLEYARSNIMHPTAEGLARTAQLNFEKIQSLEGNGP